MKFSSLALLTLLSTETAEASPKGKGKKDSKKDSQFRKCNNDGSSDYPFQGRDNSQRLLLREGVISEIPSTQCPKDREGAMNKNVILVVGDGMVSE
jgi:hypothetical protein